MFWLTYFKINSQVYFRKVKEQDCTFSVLIEMSYDLIYEYSETYH